MKKDKPKITVVTNLVGIEQQVVFTELEELLISAIDNFILWNTTHSDRGLAEEYIANEDVNYNEWFEIKKEKK